MEIVTNERFEQEVQKHLTLEQRIQSDARSGVLRHLMGDKSLSQEQLDMVGKLSEIASKNALAEYDALKNVDPALRAMSIIDENKKLFEDSWRYADHAIEAIKRMRERILENATLLRKDYPNISEDELVKKIGTMDETVRMDQPRDPNKFDNNLALLRAFKALPDDVTNLRKFIVDLPVWTPDDNRVWDVEGRPSRAVRISSGYGYDFRDLPSRELPDVYISGSRLYSTSGEHSQWGFGLMFSREAVRRILKAKNIEDKHSN